MLAFSEISFGFTSFQKLYGLIPGTRYVFPQASYTSRYQVLLQKPIIANFTHDSVSLHEVAKSDVKLWPMQHITPITKLRIALSILQTFNHGAFTPK